MTFGERMSEARKNKQLTQKRLAEILGVSPMRISHYESNSREPDIENIKKISHVLEVSPDWLIGTTKEPTIIDGGLKAEILKIFASMSPEEQVQWVEYAEFLRQRRLR